MSQYTIDETKTKMEAAIEHVKQELKNIRTGRANPALLDNISVEVYGTQMRLKELATITVPEPRMLLVTPFDRNNCDVVGKAIERADLGVQPIVEGNLIRINIPPIDKERRNEYVNLCHRTCEESKVSVRNVRRDANETVRNKKNQGDVSEDELKNAEKKIQDLTDQYCKQADELAKKKEEEILTI